VNDNDNQSPPLTDYRHHNRFDLPGSVYGTGLYERAGDQKTTSDYTSQSQGRELNSRDGLWVEKMS